MRLFGPWISLALAGLPLVLGGRYHSKRQATNVDLGTVELGVRGIAGMETCPPLAASGSLVRILAAVTVDETALVSTTVDVDSEEATVTGMLHADANICLCVDATLPTDLGILPASFLPAAALDLRTAASDVGNPYLSAAVDAIGSGLDVQLNSLTSNPCTCPEDAVPTCTAGHCGCRGCPAGETYNAATGRCLPICTSAQFPVCADTDTCICLPCPLGAAYNAAEARCKCPAGQELNENGTLCMLSPSAGARLKKREAPESKVVVKRQTSREAVSKRSAMSSDHSPVV